MACRGTGRVISNLGGTPSTVTCPWCAGGGIRLQGIDAQARWLDDTRDQAHSESPEEPPAEPPGESPAASPDPAA
jgi:hypothetical protein